MNRKELKHQIAFLVAYGECKSYLEISFRLNAPSELVRDLFRELQIEWEMELYSCLVE